MKILGWMDVVDDFGNHRYRVTRISDGCYYFAEKTLGSDHKLRYNSKEGRIEEFVPEKDYWDVFSQYIYQTDFFQNQALN